jgi:PGF-CTERM protein
VAERGLVALCLAAIMMFAALAGPVPLAGLAAAGNAGNVSLSGSLSAAGNAPTDHGHVYANSYNRDLDPNFTYTQANVTAGGNYSATLEPNRRYDVGYYQYELSNLNENATGAEAYADTSFPRDGVPDVHAVDNVSTANGDVDLGNRSLPEAHALNVTLVDQNGVPVEDVYVTVGHHGSNDSSAYWSVTTDEQGRMQSYATAKPGVEVAGNVSLHVNPRDAVTTSEGIVDYGETTYSRRLTVTENTTEEITVEADRYDLALSANRSTIRAGEPVRLTLVRNDTGDPIPGTVSLDGEPHDTGPDGSVTHTFSDDGTKSALVGTTLEGNDYYAKTVEVAVEPEPDDGGGGSGGGGGGGGNAGPAVGQDGGLGVRDLAVDRAAVPVGGSVAVSVTVSNTDVIQRERLLTLEADGETVAERQVVLGSGDRRTVSFDYGPSEPGEQTVSVGAESATVVVSRSADSDGSSLDAGNATATPTAATTTPVATTPGTTTATATTGSGTTVGTGGAGTAADGGSTSGSVPGFGATVAVLALLGAVALARR